MFFPGLPIQSESDSILDTPEKRVIEWKFSELDINKDNLLRKKEVGLHLHYVLFWPVTSFYLENLTNRAAFLFRFST